MKRNDKIFLMVYHSIVDIFTNSSYLLDILHIESSVCKII